MPITGVYDHGGTYSSTSYTEYNTHFAGKRHTVTTGQTFSLCNQVTLKVVSAGGTSSDENARSVAVKITYGAFDALVGGDLTGSGPDIESAVAPSVGELELYKVHHHGSSSSSNATFLGITKPLVSFISVGFDNSYGHPTVEALTRLANVGSDVWQTEDPSTSSKLGHIELDTTHGNTFTVSQGATAVTYTSKGMTDTQPPTAPGSLVATATSSSEVDLSWSASTDDLGVTGYNVYRSTDGSSFPLAGTSSTTGFADLGLSGNTTYWYRVTARDAVGNESAVSNTASAVTPAPPSTSLTVTSPNGGESWAGGSSQTITWASSNVSNVKLEYSLDNGSSWTVIASGVAASTGSYSWTVPDSASTLALVRASDALNSAPTDTSNGTFTITASGPAVVILNEILANEPGSATSGEFVELVNAGGTAIDIGGWKLTVGGTVRHTFATGTTLAAGKAIVVFGAASGIPAGTPNAVAASSGGLGLLNSSATVAVKNGKKTLDSFSYTSSLASTDGVSMNRGPDATATGTFVLHTSLSSLSASAGARANGSAF
ncbi:lamin tail domain-containing protein [Myxococcus sp. RHSTA-1-4]|uniref:lamin tail domain-containing protein n=1 Tax=Myxococcus sp. RHSTA-1-4 TaxID=2874601 RepID=UPI001CC01BE2